MAKHKSQEASPPSNPALKKPDIKHEKRHKKALKKALDSTKDVNDSPILTPLKRKPVPSPAKIVPKTKVVPPIVKSEPTPSPTIASKSKTVPSSSNNVQPPSSSEKPKKKDGHNKRKAKPPTSHEQKTVTSNVTTKPKSVALPPNNVASTSSDVKSSKRGIKRKYPNPLVEPPKQESFEQNGFVEIESETEANGSQVPPLQKASSKARKTKRSQNGFVEEPINVAKVIAKKAKRVSSGFVETNLDDEDQTRIVDEVLKEERQRIVKQMGYDPTIPVEKFPMKAADEKPAPSIIVHNVPSAASTDTNSNSSPSDSEDDSYIDRFFKGNGANGEFNSNEVLSADEFEKLSGSDFLSSGSDSDQSASVSGEPATTAVVGNGVVASKKGKKSTDHKTQMVRYNGDGKDSEDSGDSGDSEDSNGFDDIGDYFMDGDSDDYDFGDYFDESDGEYVSDGDDYGVGYTDSSGDGEEEGEEEESDDYSYEDDSDYNDETSDLEYGSTDEYYGHSDSDQDDDDESTYDEFMSGRFKDDSNDTDFYDSDYDDMVIAQGTAITYKLTDSRIHLFKNDEGPRIIELEKSDTEEEDCVELVSLNVTREEILNSERRKRQTKKMRDDLVTIKAKQREAQHQQKLESYFKMDESATLPSPSVAETSVEDVKPVVITCLPGIVSRIPIDDEFTNRSTSDSDSEQLDLDWGANLANQSIISTAPSDIPPTSLVEMDDVEMETANRSEEDEGTPETALQVVESGLVGFSQSERIKNRNTNLTKSQIAKTKPKFFNSINSQHVLLLLRNIIHFHGNLQAKLIAGNAQVFGYQLEWGKYVTVHSPRGHSLIYMVPTPPKRNSPNNTTSFAALNELKVDFLAQDIDELMAEFSQSTDAIILLERDTKHKGVNMIDRYMRETMFPNINAFNNESPYYSSEFILRCQFSFRPRNSLVIDEAWSTVPLKNSSKLATIGGKGVGKSTFVRYIINSNIRKSKKFVFIDLDIGQPELFVPQTISATLLTNPILGPGYLENIPPTKAIFFGEINVLLNPIKYLRSVVELYEFCSKCEAFQNVPWVINTMGYTRSLGSELMACILRIFQPTDVVQIQSNSANENFGAIIDADYVNAFKFNIFEEEMADVDATCNYRTHTFNAIIGNDSSSRARQTDMTPKDIRYAMILSKLGNCLSCNSDWLTSIRPFEASLNDLKIIDPNGDTTDAASAADVLNANLVYLCESKEKSSKDILDCHGIGIVRAIDKSTEKLYLLSSIPMEELAKVNVLAIGAIPLPSAVLLNQHGQVRGTVPFVYNSDGFVGSKQVAQHIYRSEKNRKNPPIELMER